MSELPKGWRKASLGEFVKLKNGYAFKSKDFIGESDETVPVLRISDLRNGIASISNAANVHKSKSNERFIIEKGDLLIAMSGATTGKMGVYSSDEVAYQNQRVGNLRLIDEDNSCPIYRNYLIAYLKDDILKKAYGAAQPNISAKELESIEVALAPFNEQIRIADKLDSVLAKVEAAQARLDKIPTILKRFRQSVLAAATSGELTKEWREENVVGLKISPKDVENDAYDVWSSTTEKDIPSSWGYFKLYELGSIQGGGTPRKSVDEYWNGEVPWVTPKDMKIDFISTSKLKVTDIGVTKSSAKYIEKNSLLFVVRGMILAHSFPVAKTLDTVTINQDMKALTPIYQVNSDYLLFTLKSLANVFVELASSSTHGTKRLEAKMYNNVAIPVPSLEEQIEIVRVVSELMTKAALIEKQYKAAKARLDKLTQSILAKAFRGELLGTDESNEIEQVVKASEALHA